MPQIEVTFDINADGIVNVSAKDKATGKEQRVTIEASSGLNQNDIDRMVNEAKEHEAEDKKRREVVDARNELDSFIFSAEKSVKDYGDKLQASDVDALKAAIEEAKKHKDSEDLDELKKAKDDLMAASHKLAEVMYAQANQQGAGAAPGAGAQQQAKKDDDVIDAEFEEN